jgi:hypothetical protein
VTCPPKPQAKAEAGRSNPAFKARQKAALFNFVSFNFCAVGAQIHAHIQLICVYSMAFYLARILHMYCEERKRLL